MTVIQLHPYGRGSGFCPECTRETANLAKHVPACRRAHAKFYAESDLGPDMWQKVERAAAHSDGQAFDLEIARVMLYLERGGQVQQTSGPYRWLTTGERPLSRMPLQQTVDEMTRTGLARAVSERTGDQIAWVHLVAAPVHLRAQNRSEAVCAESAPRLRLVDHQDLVDCTACLGQTR